MNLQEETLVKLMLRVSALESLLLDKGLLTPEEFEKQYQKTLEDFKKNYQNEASK